MSVVFEECNAPSISKVTDILSVEVFKLQYINAVCGEYSAPLLKDYTCRLKKNQSMHIVVFTKGYMLSSRSHSRYTTSDRQKVLRS
jgi:hypothetical protein